MPVTTDYSALPTHERAALAELAAALNASGALADDGGLRASLAHHAIDGSVRALSARYGNLDALPSSLGHLANLHLLDLTGNRLAALPEMLASLLGLKRLSLDGNTLTALPDWIGSLGALEELHLDNNELVV